MEFWNYYMSTNEKLGAEKVNGMVTKYLTALMSAVNNCQMKENAIKIKWEDEMTCSADVTKLLQLDHNGYLALGKGDGYNVLLSISKWFKQMYQVKQNC